MRNKRGGTGQVSPQYNSSKVPRIEAQINKIDGIIDEILAITTAPIGFNKTIVTSNVTFAEDQNGISVGPIIIRSGIVKVQNDSRWLIL